MITYKLNIHCQEMRYYASDMEFVTGDVGAYCLEFTFLDNNKKMDVSHYTLTIKGKRADGVVLSDAGEILDGVGRIVLKNGFYAVPGTLELEIALTDGEGNHITTKILSATVIEGAGTPVGTAENETNVYVTLIAQLQSQLETARTVTETIEEELKNKVDKVPGKTLSANNYSDEEKEKLSEIYAHGERLENKVTDFADRELTDEQYPSAKLVYSSVNGLSNTIAMVYDVELPKKANKNDVYTKEEVDGLGWQTLAEVTLDETTGNVREVYLALNPQQFISCREYCFYMEFPAAGNVSAQGLWPSVQLTNNPSTAYNVSIASGGNVHAISTGETVRLYAIIQRNKNIITSFCAPIIKHVAANSRQNAVTTVSTISGIQDFVEYPVHIRVSGLTLLPGTKIWFYGRK